MLRVRDAADAERYRVEPYVVPADVYGVPPHTGRGGWTWYTGSAAWLYRLGVEAILGIRRRGDALEIAPCIPASWKGFEATYRHGGSTYHITVRNSASAGHGAAGVEVDGARSEDGRVPLVDDGREHRVMVRQGSAVRENSGIAGGG